MDPVTLALIGSLVNVGVGGISNWLAGSKDKKERQQRELALQQYMTIAPPQHQELVAREVARSRMADVRRDPTLEAAQDEALSGYLDVARNGESARGRADYERAAQESAQQERSNREAAVARAVAMGLGPEAAFTDSLVAGQGGADRERMAGLQRAAMDEEARMGALGQAGSMAASRSAARWGQDAQVAQAQDEMDMFNAGQWNEMARYNNNDRYNAYEAQLARADRIARERGNMADMYSGQGQRIRDQGSQIGGGLNRIITAPGVYGATGQSAQPQASPASTYKPTTLGAVGANAALQPALDAQKQQMPGVPNTTSTRRKAR